ncbi:MAG TPA: MAPEG family protein [Caulobacteraceae bacterium]
MTPDLVYLAWTALLTAALWIPYVICQVISNGPLKPAHYADPAGREAPAWGKRAYRAHLNAVESFAPFAALVFIAHLSGKTGGHLALWATAFFWIRLAHAVVHLLGVPYLRTILFTLGFVCVVGLFVVLIR